MTGRKPAKQRMSRIDDARAVRSRAALRMALLELIGKRPFDELTIKVITNAAGVSYPVFFRQFAKKEELLEDLAAEEVRHLLQTTSALFDPRAKQSGKLLCKYVQDHRKLWTALLTAGAVAVMRQEFIRIARETASTRERQNPQLPVDLASNVVVSGIFEVLAWWLKQPENYPLENVIKMLDSLVVQPVQKPIKLKPFPT